MPETPATTWHPDSWRTKLVQQQVVYPDRDAVEAAHEALRALPPLVTSWEIEKLKEQIAEAQAGKRFLLQGGDCAEQLASCTPADTTRKLKILLQMSLVLVHGSKQPVIRVGRFAGQYAKPRSSPTETREVDGQEVTLPSYFGDLVNRLGFTENEREPNPMHMVEGYKHAAMTLNFVRSLIDGGFADVHHPEYWDLGFMQRAGLPAGLAKEYEQTAKRLADALDFMEAVGERAFTELTRVEFFTSHEGLNLLYESAQTRTVPRRLAHYNMTAHLPWLGNRTRQLDGAHVEYFRGIANPVGVKIDASIEPSELVALIDTLNPTDEAGKVVLITRLGKANVKGSLPGLVRAVQRAGKPVLWVSDPMHGNSSTTDSGIKTRRFEEVIAELDSTWDVLRSQDAHLGGVHIELTGEDVTECVGGASGLTEADLSRNYRSPCDPRLNYEQSLELAFHIARKMTTQSGGKAE